MIEGVLRGQGGRLRGAVDVGEKDKGKGWELESEGS